MQNDVISSTMCCTDFSFFSTSFSFQEFNHRFYQFTYGEISDANWIMEKPFKGHSPAGYLSLSVLSAALDTRKAGIAVDAVRTVVVLEIGTI